MQDQRVFDRAHFDEMTGGDRALQTEVLALFEEQAALWRRLLTADSPVRTWRDAVHTLKGSARGLGLWVLAESCERAEAVSRGVAPDSPTVAETLTRLRADLGAALEALDRWRVDAEQPRV